jgi:hypothetical protein
MKKGEKLNNKIIGAILKKLGEEIEKNNMIGGNIFDSLKNFAQDVVTQSYNRGKKDAGGMMLAGDESRMFIKPKGSQEEELKNKNALREKFNKKMMAEYGKSLLASESDEEGGNAPSGQLDMVRGGYKAVIYDDIHEYGSGKRTINKKASDALKYFQSELKKYREAHPNTPYRECQKIISQRLKK